jgi:hypothetical protein
MKVILGVAVAAMLFAAPALAQTTPAPAAPAAIPASSCGEAPATPTLPDGATASRRDMDAANTTYTSWAEAYRANVQCRHAEAEALQAQAAARAAEHNAAVELFNTTTTAWEADVAEYNARPGNRRR